MNPERWQRIDQLLQSTLARAPEERAAFLAAACAGDESLRAEVGSLLAAHEEAGGLLEAPLSQVAADVLDRSRDGFAEGQTLGPYRVLGKLGAGGMGEVYRARDERIGREVAIKVLRSSFSADPDRLRRFEQEARAAGALNHPNILTLHDVGRHDRMPYLVSELLEGETLRARLERGALPRRKAVETAVSITDGLAAAHAKGIVHRDLKPENVFVTSDGRVKVLDFGLAKLRGPSAPSTDSAVATAAMTEPGVVLGTAGYMSPEQAAGTDMDTRGDLFALGCILYEMITGRRAFRRRTAAETMAAVLNEEPPEVDALPAELRRLIAHCLEKDPDARFQSARDLLFNLRSLGETETAPPARRTTRGALFAVVAIAGAIAAIAATVLVQRFQGTGSARPSREPDVIRFAIAAPENGAFTGPPRVSPDGRSLLTSIFTDGRTNLWLRPMGAASGQIVPGTQGAFPLSVSWSADGRSALFAARGKLVRVDLENQGTKVISDSDASWGTSVSPEGVVLLGRDGGGIHRVPAAGGTASPVLTLDASRQEVSHYWPQFLPDGRHFLYFSRSRNPAHNAVCVASLDGRTRKPLFDNPFHAQYSAGHLLYIQGRTLVARRFDLDRLELAGDPLPLTEDVGLSTYGMAMFSVSGGVLVYRPTTGVEAELVWFDRSGRRLGTLGTPGQYGNPELSPDGGRVVLNRADGSNMDIWTIDVAQGTPTRLTFDPEIDHIPVWSPDGSRVVFDSHRSGAGDLYQKASNGTGAEELLLSWDESMGAQDWSRDGRFILFTGGTPATRSDLWVLPLEGDRKPFPYLHTAASEGSARFSPDGRWVAYNSDESGQFEVYVQGFSGAPGDPRGKWQVSNGSGVQPLWRRDGRELFYVRPGGSLMAVDIKAKETFEAGTPHVLFEQRGALQRRPRNAYAVSADGQRFLIGLPAPASAAAPTQVLVGWPAAVGR